jgi:hypothetical protein
MILPLEIEVSRSLGYVGFVEATESGSRDARKSLLASCKLTSKV